MSQPVPCGGERRTAAPRSSSTTALAIAVVALVLAACSGDKSDPIAPKKTTPQPVTVTGKFEWSMPDRFGLDANGDGLIDYPDTSQIHPASWRVDLDACSIHGTSYTWYVDGRAVGTAQGCKYAYQFPAEGAYDVAVHIPVGTDTTAVAEQTVVVQDWLIVSLGDSYASGEGVPEVPMASDALVARIEGALRELQAARLHLTLAQESLQEALAARGTAKLALDQAKLQLQSFLSACSQLLSASCVNFLKDLALSFTDLTSATAYFERLVSNAQSRYDAAVQAVTQAQAAVAAAQAAVADLRAALAQAQAGFVAPRWQKKYAVEEYDRDDECHRSANAAPAQAARELEAADPHTSVTFVHLACSGAKMVGGRAAINAQIRWANTLIGNREIDAVLISIGGNDAGFSSLATACAEQAPCYADDPKIDLANVAATCALLAYLPGSGTQCTDFFDANTEPKSAKLLLADGIAALPGRYGDVATQYLPTLRGLRPPGDTANVRSDRVFITEYVNMTKDQSGSYCAPDPQDLLGTMPGFTPQEMQWLDTTAGREINAAVEDAANRYGWHYVSGIYAGYTLHGYCALTHWVNRLDESYLRQGDMSGVAHPDLAGQQFSAGVIEAALLDALYPDGLGAPPRAPDKPSLAAASAGPR